MISLAGKNATHARSTYASSLAKLRRRREQEGELRDMPVQFVRVNLHVPGVAGRSTVVTQSDTVHSQARLKQTMKVCLRQLS